MEISKKQFETEYLKIWIEKGIIHTTYTPDLVVSLEIAKKIVADRIAYTGGHLYPGLVDIRNIKSVDYGAMKYWATEESYSSLSSIAVFSDKRLSKIFFNFWLKVDKPYRPTKYFNDKESAYLFLQPNKFLN
ncbi:MAG: hypothetical protein HRT72_02745 [Flavobacteriales bacterium]|nr:hypothetical protein [Flavobacteriales bacterium]